MNCQNNTFPSAYPWYDDRVTELKSGERSNPLPQDQAGEAPESGCMPPELDTPQKIYEYLNQYVWKQDDAKRAASIITYNCLRGVKSNSMYVGPTGCGKTYIWRCLQKAFPGMIEIVDGSSLSQDGWKGDVKWRTLLAAPAMLSGNPAILVIDEADKMLMPKYTSHGENTSHSVQSEGLTMLEGTCLTVKDGPVAHEVDTSRISFVLCGAFSSKAHAMADSGRHIGFGTDSRQVKPYEQELCEQDLIDFGVMPEFLGRIQRLVSLEPMTEEDYYQMTGSLDSFLQRIREQYRADIRLTPPKRRELAELACSTGLGIRGMENRIRKMMDDALFENCQQKCFEF